MKECKLLESERRKFCSLTKLQSTAKQSKKTQITCHHYSRSAVVGQKIGNSEKQFSLIYAEAEFTRGGVIKKQRENANISTPQWSLNLGPLANESVAKSFHHWDVRTPLIMSGNLCIFPLFHNPPPLELLSL